jgi:glycerol-3-phosphate O-acyltransferase/dihydroxyacetone phosphate acyltransferase
MEEPPVTASTPSTAEETTHSRTILPTQDNVSNPSDSTNSQSTPQTASCDPSGSRKEKNLPPLAPIAQPSDSTVPSLSSPPSPPPPLTPRTRQKQLHFSDTPLTHSYDPQTSTPSPRLPSASSSRSTALGIYSSSTPATPHHELPPPTLPQTVQDLRTLLKSFLVVIPSSLRKLRFIIPTAVREVARVIIHQVAMVLHARNMLASNWLYDFVATLWRGVINIFFREIRSRGAWKIPRKSEGATIFVVGPHHNQVSPSCSLCRFPVPLLLHRTAAADQRS